MKNTTVNLFSGDLALLDFRQWLQSVSKSLNAVRSRRSFERKRLGVDDKYYVLVTEGDYTPPIFLYFLRVP